MKKFTITLGLTMVSIASFAYGSYSSHDETSTFVIIVYIVCGILSTILFFKHWRACNDIRLIKNEVCKQVEVQSFTSIKDEVMRFHLLGKDDDAFELLNNTILGNLIGKFAQGIRYDDSQREVEGQIKMYAKLYEIIGKEIPQNIKDFSIVYYNNFGK